jgi:hypothetical protein
LFPQNSHAAINSETMSSIAFPAVTLIKEIQDLESMLATVGSRVRPGYTSIMFKRIGVSFRIMMDVYVEMIQRDSTRRLDVTVHHVSATLFILNSWIER